MEDCAVPHGAGSIWRSFVASVLHDSCGAVDLQICRPNANQSHDGAAMQSRHDICTGKLYSSLVFDYREVSIQGTD